MDSTPPSISSTSQPNCCVRNVSPTTSSSLTSLRSLCTHATAPPSDEDCCVGLLRERADDRCSAKTTVSRFVVSTICARLVANSFVGDASRPHISSSSSASSTYDFIHAPRFHDFFGCAKPHHAQRYSSSDWLLAHVHPPSILVHRCATTAAQLPATRVLSSRLQRATDQRDVQVWKVVRLAISCALRTHAEAGSVYSVDECPRAAALVDEVVLRSLPALKQQRVISHLDSTGSGFGFG